MLTAEHRTEAAGQPGGIRHALVARIRRQIAEGTYETPDKWEVALARIAHDLDIAG
ncbi:MAG TPA: flagellar biosynthesis anti-sigma factor FlgM [Gemmataceae bacterium]